MATNRIQRYLRPESTMTFSMVPDGFVMIPVSQLCSRHPHSVIQQLHQQALTQAFAQVEEQFQTLMRSLRD